jgi:hypothetical protein
VFVSLVEANATLALGLVPTNALAVLLMLVCYLMELADVIFLEHGIHLLKLVKRTPGFVTPLALPALELESITV